MSMVCAIMCNPPPPPPLLPPAPSNRGNNATPLQCRVLDYITAIEPRNNVSTPPPPPPQVIGRTA